MVWPARQFSYKNTLWSDLVVCVHAGLPRTSSVEAQEATRMSKPTTKVIPSCHQPAQSRHASFAWPKLGAVMSYTLLSILLPLGAICLAVGEVVIIARRIAKTTSAFTGPYFSAVSSACEATACVLLPFVLLVADVFGQVCGSASCLGSQLYKQAAQWPSASQVFMETLVYNTVMWVVATGDLLLTCGACMQKLIDDTAAFGALVLPILPRGDRKRVSRVLIEPFVGCIVLVVVSYGVMIGACLFMSSTLCLAAVIFAGVSTVLVSVSSAISISVAFVLSCFCAVVMFLAVPVSLCVAAKIMLTLSMNVINMLLVLISTPVQLEANSGVHFRT